MTLDTPMVLINFDDVSDTVYSAAFPYMQTKGIDATAYMASDLIGDANYCSAAQLLEMQAGGWVIGNHSKTHAHLTSLTQAQQETELDDCRDALAAIGITTGNHVAYPYGENNADTLAAMTAQGMLTGRTVVSGGFTVPVADKRQINCMSVGIGTTLAAVKTAIDTAMSNRQILIILFHVINETPAADYDWSIADFQALINYIVGMGYPTGTIADLYPRL